MTRIPMAYDTEKYKIQRLPHPLLLHWILNPGLAVNEVFFGQRIPQVMLIDKVSAEPLIERQYVPCPHCGSIHKGMLWGGSNAFGHWFGLICPSCKGKIPSLWNVASLLLLAISFPIWLPIKAIYEKRYLEYEFKRFARVKLSPEVNASRWWKIGLGFGFFYFLIHLLRHQPLTLQSFAFAGISGVTTGLLFGGFMWFFMGRKRK